MPTPIHSLGQALQNELATHALIELVINFVMKQKINTWLDLEIALESIQSVYNPQTSQALIKKFLPRIAHRAQTLDLEDEPNLSDWLTSESDAKLKEFFTEKQIISSAQIESWIKHPLSQQVMQSFVEETLQRFAQKLTQGFEGKGLLGAAGRGALGWAAKASRGAFSGLGEQFQQQLSSATQDFISLSMNGLLELLIQILNRPEISQQVTEAQIAWYEQARITPISQHLNALFPDSSENLSDEVVNEWSIILSESLAHVLEHEALADLVGQVHQHLLSEIGEQSPLELINDDKAVSALKDSFKSILSPLIMRFAQQEEFQNWCTDYLETDS